jgi:hypothetical protein
MESEGWKQRILKYELPIQDEVILELPSCVEFLSVKSQINKSGEERIVLYAEHNERYSKDVVVKFTFRIVGTGEVYIFDRVSDYVFMDTVSLYGGRLMFHVFRKKKFERIKEE